MTTNTAIRTNNDDLRVRAQATREAQAARTALIRANKEGAEMLRMVGQGVWDGQPVPEAPKVDNTDILRKVAQASQTDRTAVIRSLAAYMDN
jgi:hypothetical protein